MTIDLNHNFTSFVLLDEVDFNFSELKSILEDKFNIKIADENFTKEGVIFSYENMLVTLNLIKNPIPNHEAEYYANFNFMWKDALEPSFYIENAKMLDDNRLPVYNWIYVSVYPSENGVNAYTYGLRNFDKLELEVCDLNIEEKELFFCIYDIVLHILTYDINLKDKDILKFEDGKEIKFIKSQGISVENESLKIIF
ncbi:DUF4261 domain-containing protein [Campylobacter jejuni]|nr:DUF4261 domain-containing protein [Campylobacter jejuni]EJO1462948.1 DUF4261 domain-containing protein [Campylobacter jejuni]EKJ9834263.1 DUF4261 domain-containing protein [Campylobacter jejuni]EKO5110933.1 DUF4261 domain-containing protein [Campylobacter jejuni]EKY9369380.1 DUF4261 domain-containing protein [Campylobacter jejuni]